MASKKDLQKQLLSLDGGGVRGISSLLILNAIMKEVKTREIESNLDLSTEDRKPVHYFHLAAGTSTGGLAAVMLFRLRMTVSQAMAQYRSLAKDVFSPRFFGCPLSEWGTIGSWLGNGWTKVKAIVSTSQFSDGPLKEAINTVIRNNGLDASDEANPEDAMLRHKDAGRLIMCATLTDKGESVLFRSFTPWSDAEPVSSIAKQAFLDGKIRDISISYAARATSAAPTYLPEVEWEGLRFWDGGLLNNNPIHQLWAARFDTTDSETATAPVVGCVLSLGTSWSKKPPPTIFRFINTVSDTIPFLTNTEAKHRDFERELNRLRQREPENKDTSYFRFNTPTEDKAFNLDDYQGMNDLERITTEWLKTQQGDILKCANLLQKID